MPSINISLRLAVYEDLKFYRDILNQASHKRVSFSDTIQRLLDTIEIKK
ncbi:MAG: hypothetical protein GF317_22775 [Candidatus Lokiarchaeota archaeon]|nr:hypothetical protein [Candidatus Lokiarchaeota archaeon]